MAFAPLAVAADLAARNIDPGPAEAADALLSAASEAVRSAAGVPISQHTATFDVPAPDGQYVELPQPVVSVEAVAVDGDPVADFRLVGGRLWRSSGWRGCSPAVVTVTGTFGYAEVPADIVDLVCALVGAAARDVEGGYAATAGVQSRTRRIDDYSEHDTFETGVNGVSAPMELPKPTREWLRRRFSGGVFTSGVLS